MPNAIVLRASPTSISAGPTSRKQVCLTVSQPLSSSLTGRFAIQIIKDRDGILSALFDGLNDYTIDERGEVGGGLKCCAYLLMSFLPQVGSLVRNTCLEEITSIVLLQHRRTDLSPILLDKLALNLLKLSCEPLSIVRQQAARQLLRLFPVKRIVSECVIHSMVSYVFVLCVLSLPLYRQELEEWHLQSSALRAVLSRLPGLDRASRLFVLSGVVTSTGSPPEIIQEATSVLQKWAAVLPDHDDESAYTLSRLLQDLHDIAVDETRSNRVAVAALNSLAALLEAPETGTDVDQRTLKLIESACSDIQLTSKLKSKKTAAQRLYVLFTTLVLYRY